MLLGLQPASAAWLSRTPRLLQLLLIRADSIDAFLASLSIAEPDTASSEKVHLGNNRQILTDVDGKSLILLTGN